MAVVPTNEPSGQIPDNLVNAKNAQVALPDSTESAVGFDFDQDLNRFPMDPNDAYAAVNRLQEDEGR